MKDSHNTALTKCLAELTNPFFKVITRPPLQFLFQLVFLFGWFFLHFSSCSTSCPLAPYLHVYTWGVGCTSLASLGGQ